MSHKATNWAIHQRGLKPATKLVLWYLCDRHNPDYGCFPSQEQLAEDAEMSVSSLNDHLAKLEALGLIRRERRINPKTRRQQNTRYILGFEDDFAQEPPPNSGDGETGTEPEPAPDPSPNSGDGLAAEPSPDFAGFRLRNSETNPVREPVIEEEERAGALAFLDVIRDALGVTGSDSPWWGDRPAGAAVARWRDLGLSDGLILAAVTAFAAMAPEPPNGPKALDRAMQRAAARLGRQAPDRRRAARVQPAPPSAEGRDATMRMWADTVIAGRYIPSNAISPAMRRAMLDAGLVTEGQLCAAGVR